MVELFLSRKYFEYRYIFRFFHTIIRDEPDMIEPAQEELSVTISQLILEAHQAFFITNQDIEKLRWATVKEFIIVARTRIIFPWNQN